MKKGKPLFIFLCILGLLLTASGILGVMNFSPDMASYAMIVSMTIPTLRLLTTGSFVIGGVGVAALAGGAIPLIVSSVKAKSDVKQLESNRQRDQKQFTDYAKDSLNPEKTRIRFEQLRRNNPALNGLVERCLKQMDSIDVYQARQKSLLEANEAIYLEDTIEVLDNSEKRMCRNFRNIINCCILVEDTVKGEESLDREIIESSLSENEEELESVNTLLQYSVAYINNYNRNGVSDRSELDAWLKVMKNSMGGNNEKNN